MKFQLAFTPATSDVSDMSNLPTLRERVAERLSDLGKNPFAAAESVKLERNFINDILIGKKKTVRSPGLFKLAEALETTPEWLEGRPDASKERVQQPNKRVSVALREARRRRGFVIRQISNLLDIDPDLIAQWEAGIMSPTGAQIAAIADLLHVDGAALARGDVVGTGDVSLGDAIFVSDAQQPFSGPRDVEKLGVVAAGNSGDFQFNGEVAEYVARPQGLMGRPGVFALEVISESMYPAYRKSDVVFCDRTEPTPGDDVVIETFPDGKALVGMSFLKRLKRRTEKAIIVEQFNPPTDLSFDPYAIKRVWRVVPSRELHGY